MLVVEGQGPVRSDFGHIDAVRAFGERRYCLCAEVDNGDENAGDGEKGEGLGRTGAVRLLADQPDLPLPLAAWQVLLIDDETLLRLELVDDVAVNLVELQLLDEDVLWDLEGSAQPSAALVVVEYRLEGGAVTIDEDLVPPHVPVPFPLDRVA